MSEEFPEVDPPQITKLQIYCSSLYDLWDRESAQVELSGGVTAKIWKGSITKSAASVGAGEGVYSRVVERLSDLGCIAVLDKGRRNVPSTVALYMPPTDEVWQKKIPLKDLTSAPDSAMLLAEIKSIRSGEVGGLNVIAAFTKVQEMLIEQDKRLTELERKVSETQ